MTDGHVTLKEHLDGRIDAVIDQLSVLSGQVGELVRRVGVQNGRVNKLELAAEIVRVRDDEREHARQEAARIAAEAAKRQAALISTLISLGGLLVSAIAMLFGR